MTQKPTYEELEQRVKELKKEAYKLKQVDEALQESEEWYRSLFKNNHSVMLLINPVNADIVDANPAATSYYGWSHEELTCKKITDINTLTERQVFQEMEQAKKEKRRHFFFQHILANGDIRDVEVYSGPVKLRGKQLLYSIIHDITDSKQAEEAQLESERLLNDVFNSIQDGISVLNTDLTIRIVNGVMKKWYAQNLPLEGKKCYLCYHNRDEPCDPCPTIRCVESGQAEREIVPGLPDSSVEWIELFSYPMKDQHTGEVTGVVEFVRDITERIQAERAQRESETKYSALVENSNDGIIMISEGILTFVNKASIELVGYSPEEMIGENFFNFVAPDYRELVLNRYTERMEGKNVPSVYVIELLSRDGKTIPVELNAIRIDFEDKPADLVFIRNISERMQADEALRESEEKHRTVLEANPDPVVVYDMEGRVIYFNPAFTRVFGWTLDERINKKMDVFLPEEALPETKAMIDKVLAGESFYSIESKRFTKEGKIIPVSISGAIYKDQENSPVGSIINLRDISEQKTIEKQLHHAQKMEAIGTLAGGVAHDFNNLLMGIQGRTSLMMSDTGSPHPHSEHLKGIEDYVQSAAELTNQLLAFAKGGKYEVRPTDLNKLVKDQNVMFGRTKKEITIRGKYAENLWSAEVDQGQIEQVLLNLYLNAWQSMPAGGDLYIQTENVTFDENHIKPFEVAPGRYVKISVADTGFGMDETTRQRIFDPFFTTKEMGRGTGLGLASAYGIIKNHGGFVDVHSEKGEGSTFSLYLPASGKKVIEDVKLPKDVLKGAGTVLLVDDEEMIIDVGKPMLKKMGYNTLTAGSGKDAIEIYKGKKDQIDIVILDMIMPEMGGGDTYDKLRKINPEIKVLLSSGYSVDGQATEILERGCDGFIQKPFNMKNLSQKIREILDKK